MVAVTFTIIICSGCILHVWFFPPSISGVVIRGVLVGINVNVDVFIEVVMRDGHVY